MKIKILEHRKPVVLLVASLLLGVTSTKAQGGKNNIAMNSFIEKGTAAPSHNFTGAVWVNMNVKSEEGYNVNIGTVTFELKARTNWHTHKSGQILFVIEGIGYYQEKQVQLIQKGDVVEISKNVVHWHGASHDAMMRHIALVPDFSNDKTEWLHPVSDEEYAVHQK